jgi:hypothetical protein
VSTKRDGVAGMEALQRAVDEDDLIWSSPRHNGQHLQQRNRSVAQALRAGIPMEQIADELGVLISDVERMTASGDPGHVTDAGEPASDS